MTVRSKLAAALAASALVLVSASPAAARGYDGRWGGYHHRGHDNSGAVIGAILGVGIIAAIASSASRRDADRQIYNGGYDPRYDNRGDEGSYGYESSASYQDEDAAVDACAIAARDEATRNGSFAEVRNITGSRPSGSGWDVTGVVSERVGYRGADSRLRSFRCIWDNGRVEGVNFS